MMYYVTNGTEYLTATNQKTNRVGAYCWNLTAATNVANTVGNGFHVEEAGDKIRTGNDRVFTSRNPFAENLKYDNILEKAAEAAESLDALSRIAVMLSDMQSECDRRMEDLKHEVEFMASDADEEAFMQNAHQQSEILKSRRKVKDAYTMINRLLNQWANSGKCRESLNQYVSDLDRRYYQRRIPKDCEWREML